MFKMADYISPERAAENQMQPCVSLRCNCSPFAVEEYPLDIFEEVTDDYCILKDGVSLTCNVCGAVQKNRHILLEDQNSGVYQAPVLQCPKCKSADVKKISLPQRVLLYATCSKFLSNHECQRCFHIW